MKQPLLLLFLLFSVSCFAQQTDAEIKERIDKYLEQQRTNKIQRPFSTGIPRTATIEHSIEPYLNDNNRTPGVHALPEDGMPCLIPDQQAVVTVPNAVTTVVLPFQGAMPNAYGAKKLQKPIRLKNIVPRVK